jgi:hypothetical protein
VEEEWDGAEDAAGATRVRIGSTVTDAEIEQMVHMLMKEKGAAPSDVADQIRSLLRRRLDQQHVARLLHDERWQQRVEGRLSGGALSPRGGGWGGAGGGGTGPDLEAKLGEFHQKLQMQILEFQSALAHQVAQSMTLFAKAVRDHYKDNRSEKGGSELSSLQV